MSGSIHSLLSNSDKAYLKRELFNYPLRNKSDKEFKNQSNYELQNIDQSISDAFDAFSRGLQQNVKMTPAFEFNNLGRCMKTPTFDACGRLSFPNKMAGSPQSNPNTSPKIVGVERKKTVQYKPVYMQRHSVAFEDGLLNLADVHHRNYERNKLINLSKRSSMHVEETHKSIVLPDIVPKQITKTGSLSSVKDRISFFNNLSTENSFENTQTNLPKPNESFLSLLRQKEPQKSKTTVIRLSTLMERISAKLNSTKTLKESLKAVQSSESSTTKSSNCTHVYKLGTHSLPHPLKRKPSFERIKMAASSIAKAPTSYGTNPKRHNLMEDLSMVVPVRLRIAAFEKRILTT